MSDQPRTSLVAGFINNPKPASQEIPRDPRGESDSTAFSEVLRSEDRSEMEVLSEQTTPHATETESIGEERSRQSDEIAEEGALVREDVVAPKIFFAQEKEGLKGDADDLKTDSAQDEKGGHQADSGRSSVNATTRFLGIKREVVSTEADLKAPPAENPSQTGFAFPHEKISHSFSESIKNGVSVGGLPAEGPLGLEKAAGNIIAQGEQATGDAGDQTQADLKMGLAMKLLEKQGEIGLRQVSLEKSESVIEKPPSVVGKPELVVEKTSSVIEKPEVSIKKRASSIDALLPSAGISRKGVSGLQSGASQWMGAGSGQQNGTGQGEAFFGNSILPQVPNFQPNEGMVVQNTATDFRSILDAGRTIPDERAVLRQVTQQLRAWRPGQSEPIRFLLEPENLGMLQIEVVLKEGRLMAHMVTADPMVKALLEGSQHFLQNALKDQGLQMQQFSVDLSDQKSFMNDARNTHDFRQSRTFSEESDVIETGQGTSPGFKARNSGLSLYV